MIGCKQLGAWWGVASSGERRPRHPFQPLNWWYSVTLVWYPYFVVDRVRESGSWLVFAGFRGLRREFVARFLGLASIRRLRDPWMGGVRSVRPWRSQGHFSFYWAVKFQGYISHKRSTVETWRHCGNCQCIYVARKVHYLRTGRAEFQRKHRTHARRWIIRGQLKDCGGGWVKASQKRSIDWCLFDISREV
jgi:hypothetical protein